MIFLNPFGSQPCKRFRRFACHCIDGRELLVTLAMAIGCFVSLAGIGAADACAEVSDKIVSDIGVTAVDVTPPSQEAACGIMGHYRIGRWTAVRLDTIEAVGSSQVSIETLDGDGVRVVYDFPAREISSSDSAAAAWGYVVPGTEAAPLVIRAGDETVVNTRLPEFSSPSRGPAAIPNEMPWIVCLGDPLGVDQIGGNELLDRDPQIAVSIPKQANQLPDSSLGYEGVDVLMVNSQGFDLLEDLRPKQQRAISDWIVAGGRVFLTLGESATRLPDVAPWLAEMLPIAADIETVELNPSAIETYTSTQSPLVDFVGIRLPKKQGQLLLSGRTTRRISIPLAVDYNVGLGRITVLAADLEKAPFVDWPQRMDLIQRVTGNAFSIDKEKPSASRITAFDDLAGQTRGTLDQFSVKRKFGFSVLALILLALIALVGPLDYWLINKVLGKPLLGWMTFPVVVLGLSGVLALWSLPSSTKDASSVASSTVERTSSSTSGSMSDDAVTAASATVQCNRIEFVDIDVARRVGRGFAWNYLYSHPANQFDVNVQPAASLQSVTSVLTQRFSAPFGTPGQTFGGIQIAGEDGRMPPYQVVMSGKNDGSQIKGLAIAPRSSKSFATHLQFTPNLKDTAKINRRRGSELLEGKLINPLSVDLLDASLVYGNWVYLLPTRFRAGGTIESLDDLRQKNFRWRLSRQEMLEKNDVKNESWEASDFDSVARVAEMLMFHDAVGGTRYTGLKHGPLKQLDLSNLLVDDRCMLVGRLRDPWLDVRLDDVHQSDRPAIQPPGKTLSMVRIVLPVNPAKAR